MYDTKKVTKIIQDRYPAKGCMIRAFDTCRLQVSVLLPVVQFITSNIPNSKTFSKLSHMNVVLYVPMPLVLLFQVQKKIDGCGCDN